MFSKDIVGSDAFMDMPGSSQLLYFHLGMEADDDGFVSNPRRIQKYVGCNDDDIKILLSKRFLLQFPSGIVVVKHHRINNNWDSYNNKRSVHGEELAQLFIKENRAYTLDKKQGIPVQSGVRLKPVCSTVESSLVESSEVKSSEERGAEAPTPKQKATEFFEQVAKLTRKEEAPEMQAFLFSLHEKTGAPKDVLWNTVKDFCGYWTEKNGTGTRERWQMQKTFEVVKRLQTWFKREKFDRFRGGVISKPKGKIVSA